MGTSELCQLVRSTGDKLNLKLASGVGQLGGCSIGLSL